MSVAAMSAPAQVPVAPKLAPSLMCLLLHHGGVWTTFRGPAQSDHK